MTMAAKDDHNTTLMHAAVEVAEYAVVGWTKLARVESETGVHQ
jgi:hypothetical protein